MDCCYRFYTLSRFKTGLTATKIYDELHAVHGDSAPSKATVFRWVGAAKTASLELRKGAEPGRPLGVTSTEKVEEVKAIIEAKPRLSCRDIALEAGIDRQSAY